MNENSNISVMTPPTTTSTTTTNTGNITGRVSPNPTSHQTSQLTTGNSLSSSVAVKEASLAVELCGFNENTWFGIGNIYKLIEGLLIRSFT